MYRNRSTRLSYVVLTVAAMVTLRASTTGAQQAASLPSGWQQMSPTDFALVIRNLVSKGQFESLSQLDKAAASVYGKQLFLAIDLSNSQLDYQTIEMLHLVCQYSLPQEVVNRTRNALVSRQDNWTGQPYAEIRAKVMMMSRLRIPAAFLVRQAQSWVAAGGTIGQVPSADFKFDIVRQAFANLRVIPRSFSVEWKGKITAPQGGDYIFSISPINVNSGYSLEPIKLTMTVSIAVQNLISSTPTDASNPPLGYVYRPGTPAPTAGWASQSTPITLTAGTPVQILVTLNVDANAGIPISTVHAMLYWQSSGTGKTIVPASSLSLPDGSGPGLQATYSWTARGQAQSLTRTDSTIDFAWATPAVLLAQDSTIATKAGQALFQGMTAPNFITSLQAPPTRVHPFFANSQEVVTGLTSAQRQAFCNLLLQNATLLDPIDAKTIVRFYQAFRLGAPDEALDVFGTWAGRHADLGCEILQENIFDPNNRYAFSQMAIYTTQQLPAQAARLQSSYLELPDGHLSLPVAYTLAYSYLGTRNIAKWTAFLDAKLADQTLSGDSRVNWLLARAFVEEHPQSAAHHYPFRFQVPASWPLNSRSYLDQAFQASQSPQVKVQVAAEIIGRLAAGGQYQAAQDFLAPLANSLAGNQQATVIAWRQQLAGFASAHEGYLRTRQESSNAAYLAALKARRAKAASLNDAPTVNHYDTIINAATSP
jgi:hypothetical protein